MSVKRKDFTFTSTTGDCEIHAVSFKPSSGEIRGVIQIAHGMAEHIERYTEFANFMAENGFAVYGNDHLGHGKSVNHIYPLGYFGMENTGCEVFVEDCRKLMTIAQGENPCVPYFFFGHSMGSLVARKFTAYYGASLTGSIFCGTVGPNPACDIAIALCDIMSKLSGTVADGKLIDKLAFGAYNNKTEKRTKYDWLTRNKEVVDKYIADPLCGFYFSNRGYRDMLSLLKWVNGSECPELMKKSLPILVISGSMDPCGEYLKGINKVVGALEKTGHNVDHIFYGGARHEILNEVEKEKTMNDILSWCNDKIDQ